MTFDDREEFDSLARVLNPMRRYVLECRIAGDTFAAIASRIDRTPQRVFAIYWSGIRALQRQQMERARCRSGQK